MPNNLLQAYLTLPLSKKAYQYDHDEGGYKDDPVKYNTVWSEPIEGPDGNGVPVGRTDVMQERPELVEARNSKRKLLAAILGGTALPAALAAYRAHKAESSLSEEEAAKAGKYGKIPTYVGAASLGAGGGALLQDLLFPAVPERYLSIKVVDNPNRSNADFGKEGSELTEADVQKGVSPEWYDPLFSPLHYSRLGYQKGTALAHGATPDELPWTLREPTKRTVLGDVLSAGAGLGVGLGVGLGSDALMDHMGLDVQPRDRTTLAAGAGLLAGIPTAVLSTYLLRRVAEKRGQRAAEYAVAAGDRTADNENRAVGDMIERDPGSLVGQAVFGSSATEDSERRALAGEKYRPGQIVAKHGIIPTGLGLLASSSGLSPRNRLLAALASPVYKGALISDARNR